MTAAAILREGALYQKREVEEIKRWEVNSAAALIDKCLPLPVYFSLFYSLIGSSLVSEVPSNLLKFLSNFTIYCWYTSLFKCYANAMFCLILSWGFFAKIKTGSNKHEIKNHKQATALVSHLECFLVSKCHCACISKMFP